MTELHGGNPTPAVGRALGLRGEVVVVAALELGHLGVVEAVGVLGECAEVVLTCDAGRQEQQDTARAVRFLAQGVHCATRSPDGVAGAEDGLALSVVEGELPSLDEEQFVEAGVVVE